MHRSSEAATSFFGQYIQPLDYDYPLPGNIEPGGNPEDDDGIAFEHASSSGSAPDSTVPLAQPTDHTNEDRVGDEALYNQIILLRDGLDYLEFQESIHEGDPGRTFEIIKV